MDFSNDIFDLGLLSDSCQTNCNCKKQYETADEYGKKDKNGGSNSPTK